MRAALAAVCSLLSLPLFSAMARPQVVVYAGPNQTLPTAQKFTRLAGSVSNTTPLSFWVADGDNSTENYLLDYHSSSGVTAIGPLQTSSGQSYGWPSDLEKVGASTYGIETFHRHLYTLDPVTGLCTPVGSQLGYSTLFGLAYDVAHDVLYCVDQSSRKLLKLDRSTGKATLVLTLPSTHTDIRGLAWRKSDGHLYYCDDATESIYRVDPSTGQNDFIMALNDGPNAKVDELDFFYGRCFASFRTFDSVANTWSMQLVQLDLDAGEMILWGPEIDDCSAHSLIVHSIPEVVHWVQVAGPAPAQIVRPTDLATPVHFTQSGVYVLELRAEGVSTFASDRVVIKVTGPSGPGPSNGNRPAK